MKIIWTLAAAAALSLAACEREAAPKSEVAASPPSGPLQAAGAAQTIRADADPNLQWAASVVRLDALQAADAKLFGVAGGDPAMDGLQTHIAFFISPAEGWRVFPIGDILDYRVLRSLAGRVELEVEDNVMGADDQIATRTRRLILTWTPGADGPPESVSLIPAR